MLRKMDLEAVAGINDLAERITQVLKDRDRLTSQQ
jgi:hypothetical protein